MIVVTSLTDILVDRTRFTSPVDAVANTRDSALRAELHTALLAYEQQLLARVAEQQEIHSALLELTENPTASIEDVRVRLTSTDRERRLVEALKRLAEVQAEVDELSNEAIVEATIR